MIMQLSGCVLKRVLMSAGLALGIAQTTLAAELDLLNLSSHEVDDTSLGQNLIVKQNSATGAKYLTGYGSAGQLLVPVNMPMESEVRMTADLEGLVDMSLFLLADEYTVQLSLYYSSDQYATLNGSAVEGSSRGASGAWAISQVNTIRIAMTHGEIKVYINDVFSQKLKLRNPNQTFTQVKLTSIDASSNAAVYELKANGNVSSAATCSNSVSSGIKLTNISTRGLVSGGPYDLLAGFVVSGTGTQKVLVRGVAVDGGVDPVLTVKNAATQAIMGSNDEWEQGSSASAIRALAANYQLPDRSGTDAGLLLNLPAGVYTVQLSSNGVQGLSTVGVDAIEP